MDKLTEKLLNSNLENYNNLVLLFKHGMNNNSYSIIKTVRKHCTRNLKKTKDVKFLELYNKTLLIGAQRFKDFDAYMRYLEKDRESDKRFYEPRRKQLKIAVDALQDLLDDKLDILTISMPPGVGKSTLGIFFMSYVAGLYPNKPNLMSGHATPLTKGFYEGVLAIFTDLVEYAWHEVFPDVEIQSTNSKDTIINLNEPSRFGTITCRSIGGSLTGATRCEGYLYADDLCSGIEEAMSKSRLDTLWTNYTNDLKSRKKLGCKEIHIATRWSVHDVIGRLERMYEGNSRARFIVMPALDENGESNFNYKYGVGFDKAFFEDMRANLDEVSFKALYMNEPIEREGLLYAEDELRRYFELPATEPDAIISICDTKDKGKDYAFMPVAYVYGQDYYIEDCICDNDIRYESRLVDICLKHKIQMSRFESNAAGGRIAKDVQAEIKAHGGNTKITTKWTSQNKETKIIVNADWVKEHCLFKDKSMYAPNTDYGRMMGLLCSYTVSGKNNFDDVPDGMAMLAQFSQSLSGNKVKIIERFF